MSSDRKKKAAQYQMARRRQGGVRPILEENRFKATVAMFISRRRIAEYLDYHEHRVQNGHGFKAPPVAFIARAVHLSRTTVAKHLPWLLEQRQKYGRWVAALPGE